MAFEGLTGRLQQAFGKLRGKGKLSEEDVKLVMRDVRMALLEADVNYKVVKDFVKRTTERCVGQETLSSLNAQQQILASSSISASSTCSRPAVSRMTTSF